MLVVARFLMGIGSSMLLGSVLLMVAVYAIARDEGIAMMASLLVIGLVSLGIPATLLGVLFLLLDGRKKRAPIGLPDRLLAGASIALALFWAGQFLGIVPAPWQALGPSRGWGS
ncbi:MAG TPA: hypothetical protein VFT32_04965, partial [Candidatus Eisenbacteria bacterium]|nr:hypothetical protein [Candidatus Eisenbacteria bacterium]